MKELAKDLYARYRQTPFSEILEVCDKLYREAEFIEEHLPIFYILERYKGKYSPDYFSVVNGWIDLVDHWISSDHIAISVMRHYPVENHLKEISSWKFSENFWRRRQSLTILLKHLRKDGVGDLLMENVDYLKRDSSYYVRKAFTWVVREFSKVNPDAVQKFLNANLNFLNKTELRECSKYLSTRDELIGQYDAYRA